MRFAPPEREVHDREMGMMDGLAIIIFLLIALWSITKTLEKLADKIMQNQDKQNELLEELISSFKDRENREGIEESDA